MEEFLSKFFKGKSSTSPVSIEKTMILEVSFEIFLTA